MPFVALRMYQNDKNRDVEGADEQMEEFIWILLWCCFGGWLMLK